MQMTPWFEGEVKPIRVGVYRRRRYPHQHVANKPATRIQRFAYFDGQHWYPEHKSVKAALQHGIDALGTDDVSAYQECEWQGLTEAEAAEAEAARVELEGASQC